jgi:hypothetical protein
MAPPSTLSSDLARVIRLLHFLFALTVFLAGCKPDESGGALELTGDGPLWAPGEEWRISDEPVLIIGALEGPDAIGSVGRVADQSGVALLDDGRIAVADGEADEIRIYDASGTRLAAVGRTGDGPGEFRGIRGILAFGRDSLLAWDARVGSSNGRLSVLTADGTFVRTISVSGLGMRRVIGITEDGTMLVEPEMSTPPDWIEPDLGEYRERRLYERLSLSGERLGSFGPVPGRDRVAASATLRGFTHFARDTYVAVGRLAFYTGDSGSFEISVYDPGTGAIVRSARRPYEAVRVTAEEISRSIELRQVTNPLMNVTDRLRALREQRPAQRVMDPADVPARETHPAFNQISEDPVEHLWVRHAVSTDDSLQTWSVFDPAGTWLGEVRFPDELSIRAIGRDHIAGVVTDQFGVEYVHVFRLVK